MKMQYKEFGKTGKSISTLGFGAMRLPMENGEINDELALPMMRRAVELGVNYIDTAPYYCDKKSEAAVGRAVKGIRDKVYISTKNPIENDSAADWRTRLETSLKNLDMDYIDFYHFWGINLQGFRHWNTLTDGPIQAANRARDEGLIKHISFSYHDSAENLPEIINSGYFESILVQYNLLDRSNEENIALAHEKGLGIAIMGPVGGGRLGAPSDVIRGLLAEKPASTAEMAMRFVLANPHAHMALSGMSDMQMVEENCKLAAQAHHLTAGDMEQVKRMMEENKKLADMYCTGCKYCQPCPAGIEIAHILGLMNNHRVYGITEHSRARYAALQNGDPWPKSNDVSHCTDCGQCEQKCPQKLPIMAQLKDTHSTLNAA
jgi:predicted aldo/keto reductase-like oxidoreductase